MKAIVDLEEKWKLWQECLEGEDTNSIFNQITHLTRDAAIYRLIIEGRRLQMEKNPDQPKINPHLHNFIDRSFYQSQVSCLRRLIEPSIKSRLDGPKGVFSLSALLKDMASIRAQLTRTTYFILRQLPYGYQDIIKRENAFTTEQIRKGKLAFHVPPEFDWEYSAEIHSLFDQLSGKSQRSPDDIIQENVFVKLKGKLNSFETLTKFVDKFIAHAATPESRHVDSVDDGTITWKHLEDAHQSMYEIAEFLSLILFGKAHMPLTWKPPTMFEFWDSPLILFTELSQLESAWDEFQKETEDWMVNGNNRIWAYINS